MDRTLNPQKSLKGPIRQKITLIEKDEILGNNKEIFWDFQRLFVEYSS